MVNPNENITYKSTSVFIDTTTGEIVKENETTRVKLSTEPNYIKLYIDTVLAFKELPKTMNPLLIELLNYMGYANADSDNGGQILIINSYVKQQISKKLEIKINTIDKSIVSLNKAGIIKRIGTGTYQVNPYIFGKGEWKDIKVLRATFDFMNGDIISEFKTDDCKLKEYENRELLSVNEDRNRKGESCGKIGRKQEATTGAYTT